MQTQETDCISCDETFEVPAYSFQQVCPSCTANATLGNMLTKTITVENLAKKLGIPFIKMN